MTKSSNFASTWKEALAEKLDTPLGAEIDIFEREIGLRKVGRMDEKVFAETRLRRGAYGQRYDNGQRHDGSRTRRIAYPEAETKGPQTQWHAPGMQRIKIPFGGLNAGQMEALADLAEEYSDGILHVTTRQDIQLHFVHIEDTPDLMRRLAAVGITTREACGNTVRNVTGCPTAGVCTGEAFDVTPAAAAMAHFLLGHRDTQDFGRKFKIAFSGCADRACGLVSIHDLGFVARVDSAGRRGYSVYMGGGLGAVPYPARLYAEFVPEEEILPLAQATARVFARHGEKKNRAAARMKFLIKKIGWEAFCGLVAEERKVLEPDSRWTAWIEGARTASEVPRRPAGPAALPDEGDDRFRAWVKTNCRLQKQTGYATVQVTLPLGDATSRQFRRLATLARTWCRETVRTTVEQNVLFRWIPTDGLREFHGELERMGLGEPGAESVVDVVACPGTDTCKLGMASSRGLAGVLRERLAARQLHLDEAVRDMRIKVSGCFNSCGQHHIADLGFYGSSRTVGGFGVPHFQVLLGGQWSENAAHFGLAIGAVPSKRIPDVVDRFLGRFLAERLAGETFRAFTNRIGKRAAKEMIEDLMQVPPHDQDSEIYRDWADAREFTISDLGKGECAGEVVSVTDFDLTAAEREVFEAQILLEEAITDNDSDGVLKSSRTAYGSMLIAAKGLVRAQNPDIPNTPDRIVDEFRSRFFDTQLFFDPFAGGKFAQYLFQAHEMFRAYPEGVRDRDSVRQLVEESQLFIEAAHACNRRILTGGAELAGRLDAPGGTR